VAVLTAAESRAGTTITTLLGRHYPAGASDPVGLLGSDQQPDLAPQPGLAQLETLAATVGSAGLPVLISVTGSRRELPPGLDLTAFRIVQEALTNTLKHAPGARRRFMSTSATGSWASR